MRTLDLEIARLFENDSRNAIIDRLSQKQKQRYLDDIMKKMHELVKSQGDRQSIGGYAFEISNYLGNKISARDLEKMYRKRYMNESQVNEWGRIVKGVNTTVDVDTDEIKTQAAKFGNTVDRDGKPPTLNKKVKGKSTNVLYNLGLSEGVYYNNDILIESVLYEGFLDSAKQFLGNKFNQTAADIKGAITDVKDAGVLIKDIVSNNDYLTKVNLQLNKTARGYIKQLTQLASKSTLLSSLWDRIKSLINTFISTTGWKGFLGRLATVGFLKFIVTNAANIKDNVVRLIIDKIVDLEQLLPMATLGPFLQIFQVLVQVKEIFLNTLTNIKQKLEFGKNIQRNSKYNDYELALMEGGHSLEEKTEKKSSRIFSALTEGIMLKLERDKRAGMLVLHVKDTETGRRSEVRGKLGYETNGYDPDDPLHKLLDRIGKAANISELMNGELVSISPKHPQGADAIATAKKITNEGRQGLQFNPMRNLIFAYGFFGTLGQMGAIEKGAKNSDSANELKKVIQELINSTEKLNKLNDQDLERNKNAILNHIHDMMQYVIPHFREHFTPEFFEKKKPQINSVLKAYNEAASGVNENFKDGKKKGKSRPGRVKRAGASCKGSVTNLRSKAKKYSGERGKMYHWCANMKSGRKKNEGRIFSTLIQFDETITPHSTISQEVKRINQQDIQKMTPAQSKAFSNIGRTGK